MEQAGRSLKGQLKRASRTGAPAVVIVGDADARVRDMRTREEHEAAGPDEAMALAAALVAEALPPAESAPREAV